VSISVNEFKNGLTIELDGEVWQVVDFQHVKPGKGSAFVRSKLKNVKNGNTVEKRFNAGEKVEPARVEHPEMQYLYNDGTDFVFMDNETFEQLTLTKEKLGDGTKWLKENMNVQIAMYNGDILGVSLPNFVELKIVECEPGVKGDTATGATKKATLETGATVMVPLFVDQDDVIRVDTRTGQYLDRA